MSHTVELSVRMKSPDVLRAACAALGLPEPVHGTHRLYDGTTMTGLAVRLPGWTYPAIVEAQTGRVRYDNYRGRWGDLSSLHKLAQRYSVEATKRKARLKGWRVHETTLPSGEVALDIEGA